MNFNLDDRTINAIKERKGSFFIKEYVCNSWRGTVKNLWSGVLDAENEKISDFNEYEYQGIKIYIDKKLKFADTIHIQVQPKFLFFKPSFTVNGVF